MQANTDMDRIHSTTWDSHVMHMQPVVDWRTTDTFDITYFEMHNTEGQIHLESTDWWKIKRRKPSSYEAYIQEATSPDATRMTYKEYNTTNGLLRVFWSFYYGFKVDTWFYYDDNGILIKKVDENTWYTFTLWQLATRLKEKWIYVMEIPSWSDGTQTGVSLYRDNVEDVWPRYYIRYPVNSWSLYPMHSIILDGNDWSIIKEEILEYVK